MDVPLPQTLEQSKSAHYLPITICTKTKPTFQPLQPRFPQPIFRQHPTDRPLQYLTTSPFPHHPLHIKAFERARSGSLLIIQFLLHLLACGVDIRTTSSYNVIATIGGWIPDGFVFAHEDDGDLRGEAAERRGAGVGEGNMMPGSGVGETCLSCMCNQ